MHASRGEHPDEPARPASWAACLMQRRVAVWVWVIYLIFLFLAFFSPASNLQSELVWRVSAALQALPLLPDGWVGFARMEVLSNVAIIAPVSLLGAVIWPQLRWRDWTAFGFLAALCVEAAQGLLLPGRQASFSDVVANATGAMVGAWLYLLLSWLHRRGAARS